MVGFNLLLLLLTLVPLMSPLLLLRPSFDCVGCCCPLWYSLSVGTVQA